MEVKRKQHKPETTADNLWDSYSPLCNFFSARTLQKYSILSIIFISIVTFLVINRIYERNSFHKFNSKYKNYLDYLFKQTPKDTLLENSPPNVVFVLAESFGYYYLNFLSNELNLLGDFEKHSKEDLFFTSFLSSTRGTVFSLEYIVLNWYYPAI